MSIKLSKIRRISLCEKFQIFNIPIRIFHKSIIKHYNILMTIYFFPLHMTTTDKFREMNEIIERRKVL